MPATYNRSDRILRWGSLAVLVGWYIFAWWFVPTVIRSAYEEKSLPALNRVFSGREEHPVSQYIQAWNSKSRGATVVITLFALITVAITFPKTRDAIDHRYGVGNQKSSSPTNKTGPRSLGISPARKRLVFILGAVLLLPSMFDAITDTEQWPYSNYPMYKNLYGKNFSTVLVYGKCGDQEEFPLVKPEHINPFIRVFLGVSIKTAMRHHPENIPGMLRGIAKNYERLRLAGRHRDPPLTEIRAYNITWELDPWAKNRDAPQSVETIAEVDLKANE